MGNKMGHHKAAARVLYGGKPNATQRQEQMLALLASERGPDGRGRLWPFGDLVRNLSYIGLFGSPYATAQADLQALRERIYDDGWIIRQEEWGGGPKRQRMAYQLMRRSEPL